MKCEEVEKLMIDYLELNLEDDKRGEIEKHLESCERCLDELKETQDVLKRISKDEMEKPDESLRINFYHMLHSEIKKNEESSPVLRLPVNHWYNIATFRIAAAIALLICGTFIGLLIHAGFNNSYASNELKQ